MKRAVTLLSGGLDSAAATLLASKMCDLRLALTFDYGQRAAKKETDAAAQMCELWGIEHEVINIDWLTGLTGSALVDKSRSIPVVAPSELDKGGDERAEMVWVPNRNALLISIAAAFAEGRGYELVIAGFNVEEAVTFPDNSKEFMDATNSALAYSTKSGVELISPTIKMTKQQIASEILEEERLVEFFWCCYESGEKLCGCCESCARTIRAFESLGKIELIESRLR